MRQDPPFNMSYITATHILEKIASQTLILNNPFHVRNAPEKIFVTEFSKFMPETLITRETNEIIKFKKKIKILLSNHFMEMVEKVFFTLKIMIQILT